MVYRANNQYLHASTPMMSSDVFYQPRGVDLLNDKLLLVISKYLGN